MADLFTRLARRTLGLMPVVQPRIASRFAPEEAMASENANLEIPSLFEGDRRLTPREQTRPALPPQEDEVRDREAEPITTTILVEIEGELPEHPEGLTLNQTSRETQNQEHRNRDKNASAPTPEEPTPKEQIINTEDQLGRRAENQELVSRETIGDRSTDIAKEGKRWLDRDRGDERQTKESLGERVTKAGGEVAQTTEVKESSRKSPDAIAKEKGEQKRSGKALKPKALGKNNQRDLPTENVLKSGGETREIQEQARSRKGERLGNESDSEELDSPERRKGLSHSKEKASAPGGEVTSPEMVSKTINPPALERVRELDTQAHNTRIVKELGRNEQKDTKTENVLRSMGETRDIGQNPRSNQEQSNRKENVSGESRESATNERLSPKTQPLPLTAKLNSRNQEKRIQELSTEEDWTTAPSAPPVRVEKLDELKEKSYQQEHRQSPKTPTKPLTAKLFSRNQEKRIQELSTEQDWTTAPSAPPVRVEKEDELKEKSYQQEHRQSPKTPPKTPPLPLTAKLFSRNQEKRIQELSTEQVRTTAPFDPPDRVEKLDELKVKSNQQERGIDSESKIKSRVPLEPDSKTRAEKLSTQSTSIAQSRQSRKAIASNKKENVKSENKLTAPGFPNQDFRTSLPFLEEENPRAFKQIEDGVKLSSRREDQLSQLAAETADARVEKGGETGKTETDRPVKLPDDNTGNNALQLLESKLAEERKASIASTPTIQVTIGKIEIRGTKPAVKPVKQSRRMQSTVSNPRLSLDEYLKQRNGRNR
ncbi:hypothetical protein [Moorena producens]|uniref:hypothetical protein n=1 Tax=Moorena producens TaxID=1155739 RepID=UPI003C716480